MKKHYIVDTNVFLNDPQCIETISNGEENIILVPYKVLLELDGLKRNPKVSHLVIKAIDNIKKNIGTNILKFVGLPESPRADTSDLEIIKEIESISEQFDTPTFITNDKMCSILAECYKIKTEDYNSPREYVADVKSFSGILNKDDSILPDGVKNYFYLEEGKIYLNKNGNIQKSELEYNIWKVNPKHLTQKLAIELLLDEDIDLISIQGKAGYGKTYISLATGLHEVFQKKKYEKIVFIKPLIEIGNSIGLLPGDITEKTAPYNDYVIDLIKKLQRSRNTKNSDLFLDEQQTKLNPLKFKFMPINFIRGTNIENSYVIIDECFTGDTHVKTDGMHETFEMLYEKYTQGIKLPRVLTYNEEQKKFEYKNIVNVVKKEKRDVWKVDIFGHSFKCTSDHKFYTCNGWKKLSEIDIRNDRLLMTFNCFYSIEQITKDCGQEIVYDMEVEDNHNFIIYLNNNIGVIAHNCQNLSRPQLRTILTRMGENVKCVMLGDVSQIDHPNLNEQNNALNWAFTLLKDHENYAHIIMEGKHSRGPITDMVLKSNL